MRKNMRNAALVVALGLAAISANASTNQTAAAEMTPLETQVRRQLVMLPFYSVFDDLRFDVDGSKVTLYGQVSRPSLKISAGRVMERVEGVGEVENKIEVLPLSPNDNRIRLGVLRAIYTDSVLSRYAMPTRPSIHIIVKNGDVTLTGVVAREADKNIAFLRANGVAGAFSVTNKLRVEKS